MFTMDKLLPLSFTFFVFIFMVLKLWMRSKIKETPKNLPPSPWKLPIIGHLHLLIFALPHRRLMELAKRHGSVMQLQLEMILYNSSDIAFAPYGGYWRQLRTVCTLELLSTKRVQSFRSIREENVSSLIRSIYSNTGLEINLGEMLCNLSYNITLRTAFAGRCNQHKAFISFVKKFVESLAGFSMADLFPSIKLLHVISGMRAKLERFHHDLDSMLESIIEEHRASNANLENSDEKPDDLLDVLLNLQGHGGLEFPLTTDNIKAVILAWCKFFAHNSLRYSNLGWVRE
ncbi:premnaspirodiene oxygenase isoform X3 [Gossypium hirsutum]|uniref:Premnaspirodiene oxygenase isoform X3 n=1 Tax=Gossypium hirsutum TaxID=3635 RepID=A0A1U8KJH3_GOSHI|nr:premnaspirodiene oxygenase-like isoform X3 [Gossypium hirsutum]